MDNKTNGYKADNQNNVNDFKGEQTFGGGISFGDLKNPLEAGDISFEERNKQLELEPGSNRQTESE